MSDAPTSVIDLGPARKTADNWQLAPRPAENLDAAEVTVLAGPDAPNGTDPDVGSVPVQEP